MPASAPCRRRFARAALLLALAAVAGCGPAGLPVSRERREATGPLAVHPDNPRYFADPSGGVVYLTGSHTWADLVDSGWRHPPEPFDFDAFLAALEGYGHNCLRLWTWEQGSGSAESPEPYWFAPLPFERSGPGTARDGLPRFDLTRFDDRYFERLRARVAAARRRGFYVLVMLFDGWSIEDKQRGIGNPWLGHPFHRDNNVNGVDGDADGDGEGHEVHTLADPAITRLQEAYLRRVIETLSDQANVLWEVSNESHADSQEWQAHVIGFVRELEAARPQQHPIGMTAQYPGGHDETLYASAADWISPGGGSQGAGMREPTVADGRKVVLADTDHLCGVCGDPGWPWRAFTRGQNPLLMDPWEQRVGVGTPRGFRPHSPWWERMRRALGDTLAYAERIDLAGLEPRPELCSTRFCLGPRGPATREILAYLPDAGPIRLDLSRASGPFRVEWYHPGPAVRIDGGVVQGGGIVALEAACRWTFPGLSRAAWRSFVESPCGDAVVYLRGDAHSAAAPAARLSAGAATGVGAGA